MRAAATLKRLPERTDHHLGPFNSNIIIVEYADFQCPFCAAAVPVFEQIMQQYKDVCVIFRHFPMTTIHSNAGIAAVAAEAAGKQNKFWQMHNALFEHQSDLTSERIFSLARELKLDMRKFLNDLEDEHLLSRVEDDFDSGIKNGISGTPTIFINGVRFEGATSVEDLREEIDEILQNHQPRV